MFFRLSKRRDEVGRSNLIKILERKTFISTIFAVVSVLYFTTIERENISLMVVNNISKSVFGLSTRSAGPQVFSLYRKNCNFISEPPVFRKKFLVHKSCPKPYL